VTLGHRARPRSVEVAPRGHHTARLDLVAAESTPLGPLGPNAYISPPSGRAVSEIDVVPLLAGEMATVDGFGRRRAFETDDVRVGETRIRPGAVSPWHHHGKRTLYGYVVAGELTLEFGPGGADRAVVSAGGFVRILPGVVHRDVNAARVETVIVNVVIGEGPATVDVAGPESAAR
jgi:quercetin dioxygenase-like cupin family protein